MGANNVFCPQCGLRLDACATKQRLVHAKTLLGTAIGSVIGSYRLEELIGEGGMGQVYRARHVQLGRDVALKMLRPEFATNRMAVERFFDEARAVNLIAHEHIVEITDLIMDADTGAYYIMELLDGVSLAGLLSGSRPLPLERWLPIAMQICDALVSIHAAGIVHRDLKPDNIYLIERKGQRDWVKLLDFGVAKFYGETSNKLGLCRSTTAEGTVIGTPDYMSPEQAAGKAVDHRSDLFALGIILFQMATGRTPFAGESFAELIVSLMTKEPARPSLIVPTGSYVPLALEELMLSCLQRNPDARPSSAAMLLEHLQQVRNDLYGGVNESIPVATPAQGSKPMSMLAPGPRGTAAQVGAALAPTMHAEAAQAEEAQIRTDELAVARSRSVPPSRSRLLLAAGVAAMAMSIVLAWWLPLRTVPKAPRLAAAQVDATGEQAAPSGPSGQDTRDRLPIEPAKAPAPFGPQPAPVHSFLSVLASAPWRGQMSTGQGPSSGADAAVPGKPAHSTPDDRPRAAGRGETKARKSSPSRAKRDTRSRRSQTWRSLRKDAVIDPFADE